MSEKMMPDRCKGNSEHPACTPTFFCLHQDCVHRRLLCHLCVQEERHVGHKITYINERIDPFSRLSANCYTPNARQIHNSLYKKAVALETSMKELQKEVDSIFRIVRSKLIMPIFTIAGTYSNEMMKEALSNIQKNADNYEEVEDIAEKINYLLEHQHLPSDVAQFENVEKDALKILTQTGQTIKMALNNMSQRIEDVCSLDKSHKKHQRYGHITAKQKIPKISEEQIQLLLKLHEKSANNSFVSQKEEKSMIANEQQKEPEKMMHQEVDRQKKSRPRKPRIRPEQGQKQSVFKKQRKQHKINSYNPYYKKQEFNVGERLHVEDVMVRSQPESIMKLQESSPLKQQSSDPSQGRVYQWTVTPLNPISNLHPNHYKYIKNLRIDLLESEPKQLLTKLSKMVKLETLQIFDGVIADENNVTELMRHLPKSIRKIYFNCSNDFNKKCIEIMVQRHLYKIEVLQYYFDVHNNLKYLDESLYFRFNEQGIRIEPVQYENANYLAHCLPNLKNCWLRAKRFKPGRKVVYINYKMLESLVVGELEQFINNSKMEIDIINPQLASALMTTQQLRCLVLLGLRFEPSFFSELVSRNVHLETINVEQCEGVTQFIMNKLISEPMSKLKNFSIKDCPRVKGTFIQKVTAAEIFIMDHINTDKSQGVSLPFTSFENCNSLVYFNLFGHPFMSDDLLGSLKNSGKSLKSLNIGCTCITDQCVTHFSNFPELATLILDENTISSEALFNICSQLPKLTKLSICGFNGQKKKGQLSSSLLQEIGKVLPSLNHLVMRGCCLISDSIDLAVFPNLKTVELDSNAGGNLITTLKCSGMKVIMQNDSDV